MAYRRDDIEQVRAATDLVELVGEVTKVARTGRAVMAVCPFHQEKAPSLSIDPARGLYHCFGCGKSGDLFRFVQEIHSLDFNDAVELLARRAGVTLHRDPEAARRQSRREALIAAVEKAVAFYHQRLRRAPDAADRPRLPAGPGLRRRAGGRLPPRLLARRGRRAGALPARGAGARGGRWPPPGWRCAPGPGACSTASATG